VFIQIKFEMGVLLGILLGVIDFFLAIYFIKKAIIKQWDTFIKNIIFSMVIRLIFILISVFLIIKYTNFEIVSFLVSLFTAIFILKIIEIYYIHKKINA
jgi:hypothetical protein